MSGEGSSGSKVMVILTATLTVIPTIAMLHGSMEDLHLPVTIMTLTSPQILFSTLPSPPPKPEGGGALNSLRNFRLQKKKFVPSQGSSESSQVRRSQARQLDMQSLPPSS